MAIFRYVRLRMFCKKDFPPRGFGGGGGVPAKYFLTASLISNPFIISECKIDIHNIHLLECPSTFVMPGVNCQKTKGDTYLVTNEIIDCKKKNKKRQKNPDGAQGT